MEAPPYTPMSCEVDHIIPISRGGAAYDIDNLQLTHAKCNRQKSNRLREDYGDEDPNANLCPLSNNW
jgi:5-methylcytosine-specific restriction endonuclease McrA